MNYDEIEEAISGRQGSYKGLQKEALLTSDEDFRSIFEALPEIQTWVEPGSGHGLGPKLFAQMFPHKKAIGIEFELSRHRAAASYTLPNLEYIHADLLLTELPVGDGYFFYFPTGIVLDKILLELSARGDFKLVVIESHGDFLPRLRKESWLKEVREIPLKSSRHYPFAVVFEKSGDKQSSLHDVSFLERYLLIDDEWIAESRGLEWSQDDLYTLLTPPRSVREDQVKKVLLLSEINERFHPALHLRRLGNLSFELEGRRLEGVLRKIFVNPTFKVEISTGEQVEWSQIKKIFWENTLCFDSSLGYFSLPHAVWAL